MNEGKPTKAKWWSRPRSSEDAPDGDFELERPRPDHTAGTGTATDDRETDGGDFELERPVAPRAADEGDYELDLPRPERDEPTDVPRQPGAATAEPVVAGVPRREAPPTDPSTAADERRAPDADAPEPPNTGLPPQGDRPTAPPPPHTDTDAAAPTPAPTVTAAPTPAHGTATPPAPAASAPASAATGSVPAGPAPASAATGPAPAGSVPAATGPAPAAAAPAGSVPASAERPKPLHEPDPYGTPPYGEPGPWAPAPPVQHPAATPAHGTAMPPAPVPPPAGAVPDPAFADAPPPVPQGQHPTATPVAASHAPGPASAAAVPAYDTVSRGAAPETAAPADPWAGPAVAAPGGEPAADPWGRYDPWAASARHLGAADGEPRRRRPAAKVLVGGALLIALVSGGIGGAVGAHLERNGGVGTVELPQAGPESAERDPDSVAGIAARALPSVVTLHVSGGEAAGTGTGFVLDDRGHILTNNHVVEPAGSGGEITVTFNSGDTAEATVVGRDSGYDLAVVKVKGVSGLTPMPLGNSENVRVGDPVVAIGAPFDLAGTVTSGIISAKERPITAGGEEGDASDVSYVDALQTDAPINPGNSGGPLLDARGRAIGINSAIRSADGGGTESDGGQAGSIGLGFAIPINQGKRVAEELINTGRATHPVIGITLDMNYTGDGARVSAGDGAGGPAVTTGGPGAKAGIKPGDVITAVDGQRVHSGEELIVKTRAHRPGDRLELTLERDGKETKVSLVLGSSGGD
ncbi:S1C family serine protease [Streptomyces hyderabadensis]|uniref:PDZ domain-containing protein n=1 Tax=Streptomyces hyderabadensis TaxID=598549 RepID=A0ABP9IJK5_9ACTN|nr:trypsin-like peptidase domain-containing protein [Streptomyces hyderabadensis]